MAIGRKTGGRQAGTPNRASAEVKAAARRHGQEAIAGLVRLMREGETDAAKIAACREILDRAYGKPTQTLAGDDDAPPLKNTLRVVFVDPPTRGD
jgi:hypothetical protein